MGLASSSENGEGANHMRAFFGEPTRNSSARGLAGISLRSERKAAAEKLSIGKRLVASLSA